MEITAERTTLVIGDSELIVPTKTLVSAWLANLATVAAPVSPRAASMPPHIGEVWKGQGGRYAGVQRGRNGAPDYHLIAGREVNKSNWNAVTDSVAALEIEGHNDFTLPFRKEQALLFANVPELFEAEYYWSCEQPAGNSDCALCQGFDLGGQYTSGKSSSLRAVSVRRLVIQ